jgi:hypothetical protein
MVKGGGAGGVLEFNLDFNKDASNLVGFDPAQKQLYDLGAFSETMNLHIITEIGNATGETVRFEGFPTAMSVPYGLTGFANEEPQNLISISDIAVFEDLYPEDNVFTVYGNVSAYYYHGDGRYLSNITSNLQTVAEQDANTFRTLLMANAVTAFQVTSNILTSNGVIILGVDDDSPIKIGSSNYEGNWFSRTIALGSKAGHFTQMDDAIAIGTNAGANSQSATSIAIGANAAMISQNIQAIAIGLDSGATEQGVSAIAIGSNAGSNMQSFNAIAIGENAGMITQNIHAIAIGTGAALDNQASLAVAIGSNAGANNQGVASIAIGAEAGTNLQPNHSIIINASGEALEGVESNAFYAKPVRFVRDVTAIALGYTANNEIVDHSTITMSENLVSIDGTLRVSGNIHADGNLVAFNVENLVVQDPIVHLGNANQGVGYDTGFVMEQMDSNIALFYRNSSNELIISRTMNSAYDTTLTVDSIEHSNLIDTVNIFGNVTALYHIGDGSLLSNLSINIQDASLNGNVTTNTILFENIHAAFVIDSNIEANTSITILNRDPTKNSVHIGSESYDAYGAASIGIGRLAGVTSQGEMAIAIGSNAGETEQGANSIAIGSFAGQTSQGGSSIAIGELAATTNQHMNTIVINASNTIALETTNSDALYMAPIRDVTNVFSNLLVYSEESEVIKYSNMCTSNVGDLSVTDNIYAKRLFTDALTIGANIVMDDTFSNVITVTGNIFVSNVIQVGSNLFIEEEGANVLTIVGNAHVSNVVEVGANAVINEFGSNVVFVEGNAHVSNVITVGSNLTIDEYGTNVIFVHGDTYTSNDITLAENVVFDNDITITSKNLDGNANVHIGSDSYINYGKQSVAVGPNAGKINQGDQTVSIGNGAGLQNQGAAAIAIGQATATTGQGSNAIAMGYSTGSTGQGENAIAIGSGSAALNQGANSVAIGSLAGETNQPGNTIILNATGVAVDGSNENALYIDPIRDVTNVFSNLLVYSEESEVIRYSNMCTSNVGDLTVTDNIYSKRLFTDALTIGANIVMDDTFSNVITVTGNIFVSNVIQVGANLFIEEEGANVLTIVGNAHVSNVVEVGANAVINEFGSNVVFVEGNAHVSNVITVGSNLTIDEYGSNVVYVSGNLHTTNVVTVGSNLVIDEFGSNVVEVSGNLHTTNVVTVGSNLVIDEFGSNVVYVSGNLHTTNVVTVGSNLVIDEFGSNVVEVSGNAHISDILTIGSNVTIDEFGSNILTISGNALIDPILQVGSNITMDDLASNALIVNGNIVADRIFLDVLAIGANLTVDDVASNVISVNGNISANYYFGDGGLLSNITIQVASDKGNTTTNTVIFSNTETGLKVDSNVMVEGGVVIVSNQGTGFGNVHIGSDNYHNYGPESIGIGYNAGESNQGTGAVAIGGRSAVSAQGSNAVALGSVAGSVSQGSNAVAVGVEAGLLNQGQDAIAMGFRAGSNFQGTNAVAIGKLAGETNQHTGSIIINSSGNAFGSSNTDALFVKPIRDMTEFQSNLLAYTEEGEIVDFSNIYTSNVGDLSVSGNIYAKRIFTDAINVGANLVIDDVASNVIYVTGNIHTTGDLEAGNNVKAESNIYIGGLSALRYPMVDENNYLIDSNIYEEDGTVIINTDTEISGNLIVHGTRTELATETMLVDDVIIGIANNNTSHALDTGIVMEHPGHNVGLIHHGDEDRFTIGYTQNTAADSSIEPDANNIHVDILGNLNVQNDFSVSNLLTVGANVVVGDQMTNIFVISGNVSANYYHGDGRFLSNVQVSIQDASDIGNVTTNTVQFVNNTMAFVTDYTSNVGMNLSQINNVTITDIADGQVIKYSNTTNSWVNEYLDHTYIRVKNVEGAPISAGQVVYAAGSTGNDVINVALADASDPTKMPAIGIVNEALATNAEGIAVSFGRVDSLAADFNEGDTLYVSNATPGEVSNVQPHGLTDLIQNIGVLVKAHASTGIALVTGVGRANDIPNADIVAEKDEINYVYVSNLENDFYKIEVANLLTQTLAEVSNAGNITSNTVIFSNAETAMLIQQSNLGTDGALTVISTGAGAGNVHLGSESYDAYGAASVGIGLNAGKTSQSNYSVGIGYDAASNAQGVGGVAIGWNAGNDSQDRRAVAIGQSAGLTSQGEAAVAIGRNAGFFEQGSGAVAVGQQAGATSQHNNSIVISAAGTTNSGNSYATYINRLRNTTDVTANLMAYTDEREVVDYSNLYVSNLQDLHVVGNVFAWQYYGDGGILSNIDVEKTLAEVSNVGNITSNTIIFSNAQTALRLEDGNVELKNHLWVVSDSAFAAVKIGSQNYIGGTSYSVGIGAGAGQSSQGSASVAIGYAAGKSSQGNSATAIGHNAGVTSQGLEAVAMGRFAGQQSQNAFATAVGTYAGSFYQADKATALGYRAGRSAQGDHSLALGGYAGETSQHVNSIILNSTGVAKNTGNANATYIHTLRDSTDVTANLIAYSDEGELVNYSNLLVSNLQDLTVTGNVIAWQYYGDGGLLSNVSGELTLEAVSNIGNITSNTIIFSNAETPFEVSGGGTPNFSSQVYIGTSGTLAGIRIGNQAETTISQGYYAVAIGGQAGQSTQGTQAIAIGQAAGRSHQNNNSVAIGAYAGASAQGRGSVAIGTSAGSRPQGQWSVAIGEQAGQSYQETGSVGIGYQAGWKDQNTYSIAIGHQAGRWAQDVYGVAIGAYSGGTSQGAGSVVIGARALCPEANTIIISAIGDIYTASNANATYINPIRSSNAHNSTGILTYTSEGEIVNYSNLFVKDGKLFNVGGLKIHQNGGNDAAIISIGSETITASNISFVGIGKNALSLEPANYTVGLGLNAGMSHAAEQVVAIGTNAGKSYSGYRSISMGHNAGQQGINSYSVAIGYDAGRAAMNSYSVALGISAGTSNQGESAVAIGRSAGNTSQSDHAIAIGRGSGLTSQGNYSIAIGAYAGQTMPDNSIVLNATGSALNINSGTSKFFVKPINSAAASAALNWNSSTGEIHTVTSDARTKINRQTIVNGLATVSNLTPQVYDKRAGMEEGDEVYGPESGLVAQDLWYDTPELRHAVILGEGAEPAEEKTPDDYSAWGNVAATIDYNQVIPYLISSIQELKARITELENNN